MVRGLIARGGGISENGRLGPQGSHVGRGLVQGQDLGQGGGFHMTSDWSIASQVAVTSGPPSPWMGRLTDTTESITFVGGR